MAVYVDPLLDHGWKLRGHRMRNCHMFTDSVDLTDLHSLAEIIGMKLKWFQNDERAPHYDLTPARRVEAIKNGAIEVTMRQAVVIWKARRIIMTEMR